jgi:hypothetical protein
LHLPAGCLLSSLAVGLSALDPHSAFAGLPDSSILRSLDHSTRHASRAIRPRPPAPKSLPAGSVRGPGLPSPHRAEAQSVSGRPSALRPFGSSRAASSTLGPFLVIRFRPACHPSPRTAWNDHRSVASAFPSRRRKRRPLGSGRLHLPLGAHQMRAPGRSKRSGEGLAASIELRERRPTCSANT